MTTIFGAKHHAQPCLSRRHPELLRMSYSVVLLPSERHESNMKWCCKAKFQTMLRRQCYGWANHRYQDAKNRLLGISCASNTFDASLHIPYYVDGPSLWLRMLMWLTQVALFPPLSSGWGIVRTWQPMAFAAWLWLFCSVPLSHIPCTDGVPHAGTRCNNAHVLERGLTARISPNPKDWMISLRLFPCLFASESRRRSNYSILPSIFFPIPNSKNRNRGHETGQVGWSGQF